MGASPRRACPGSMRPSGAMPLSWRCRPCGCGRISRATCCVTSRPPRARTPSPRAAPSRARSSTRRAAATSRPTTSRVDTTPLFVLLAGAYFARTADLDFIGELWPSITQALSWIDVYGDFDGDGFVETRPRGSGPAQYGWKSSPDAVFHADGRLAQGPLALVRGAGLRVRREARRRAHRAIARRDAARHRAGRIRAGPAGAIQRGLLVLRTSSPSRWRWMVTNSPAACALPMPGIACSPASRMPSAAVSSSRVSATSSSSRAGACARCPRASCASIRCPITTDRSGRTTTRCWRPAPRATTTRLSRLRILNAQFEAARRFDLLRLPELFCGFRRKGRELPLQSPVACSPQAASAGATFLLLQSVLGITIDALDRQIVLAHPVMPDGIRSHQRAGTWRWGRRRWISPCGVMRGRLVPVWNGAKGSWIW